jgi:hypothetical protein
LEKELATQICPELAPCEMLLLPFELWGALIQAYEFNSLALNLECKRMPFMSTCETWLESYSQVALSQGREQNKCSIQKALLLIYQHLPQ